MTHPEELLADYVDGTLEEDQRAVVAAHLEGCSRCADELALARRATAALASLEEQPVPFGVTGPVLAEAGRRFEQRGRVWERLQWGAGIAAAAALVLVVALNLGDGADQPASRAGSEEAATLESPLPEGATAGAAAGSAPPAAYEDQRSVDYDDAGVESLARESALSYTRELSAAQDAAFQSIPKDALACVEGSGGPAEEAGLIRLIRAEYRGTPAYLAVYAEGPGAGQPADRIAVWVVATTDCRILTLASLRL
ncbi:MAG TPA: zf-HC2 domain-containing protein [Actinomycetota bacterium]